MAQAGITQRGHAIEARVYAEDPRAASCRRPDASCSTASRGCQACASTPASPKATTCPVHYDPLLAKVIATGETRDAGDRPPGLRAARVPDARHPHQHPVPAAHPRASALSGRRRRHRLSRRRRRVAGRDAGGRDACARPRGRQRARIDSAERRAAESGARSLAEPAANGGRNAHRPPACTSSSRTRSYRVGDRPAARSSTSPDRRRHAGRSGTAGCSGRPSRCRQAVRSRRRAARVQSLTRADAGDRPQSARDAGPGGQAGDTLVILEAMKMELPVRAPADAVGRRRCTAAKANSCSPIRRWSSWNESRTSMPPTMPPTRHRRRSRPARRPAERARRSSRRPTRSSSSTG